MSGLVSPISGQGLFGHQPVPQITPPQASQPVTTQPVAQTPPAEAPAEAPAVTSSGTPSGVYQVTTQMQNQLQQALDQAFANAKKGVSSSAIRSAVNSYLQSTGQWSAAMIAVVDQTLATLSAGAKGGIEQSNQGPSVFDTQWYAAILKNLDSAALSASAPSAGTTSPTTGDNSASLIESLLPYLEGTGQSAQATPSETQPSQPYYVAPVSGSGGGSSPLLGILLLVAAGGAGIWWYVKHEKHHPHLEAHAE